MSHKKKKDQTGKTEEDHVNSSKEEYAKLIYHKKKARSTESNLEADKVKLLALLKAIRDEMDKPVLKGMKIRDYADIFVDRYNFFLEKASELFPGDEFKGIFMNLGKGGTSLEKIRMEISLLIAYTQNDIMDIIEQAERLRQKNKWLQERLREFELKIAGIQAIK